MDQKLGYVNTLYEKVFESLVGYEYAICHIWMSHMNLDVPHEFGKASHFHTHTNANHRASIRRSSALMTSSKPTLWVGALNGCAHVLSV